MPNPERYLSHLERVLGEVKQDQRRRVTHTPPTRESWEDPLTTDPVKGGWVLGHHSERALHASLKGGGTPKGFTGSVSGRVPVLMAAGQISLTHSLPTTFEGNCPRGVYTPQTRHRSVVIPMSQRTNAKLGCLGRCLGVTQPGQASGTGRV